MGFQPVAERLPLLNDSQGWLPAETGRDAYPPQKKARRAESTARF
jgi:hypothetical protein